jgi:translation initiation factor 3 subunit C
MARRFELGLTNALLPFRRIQEEGLRTYLFTFAPHYKTLSLGFLERTFSLDRRAVNSIVSRMIWTEELPASLDQSAGVIVFHRVELTRPQQLAQILAEKVGAMVEQNEKALDIRLGGATAWGDRADGLKGDKRGEQAQERRGRGERRGGVSARGKLRVHSLLSLSLVRFTCTLQAQGVDEGHALHRG